MSKTSKKRKEKKFQELQEALNNKEIFLKKWSKRIQSYISEMYDCFKSKDKHAYQIIDNALSYLVALGEKAVGFAGNDTKNILETYYQNLTREYNSNFYPYENFSNMLENADNYKVKKQKAA